MAFNTSLSGINAANADLNVTSNNIANVNTTGFKESRAEFADMFQSTSYGLSRNAVGSGVRVSNVAQQFSQGNIDPTGRSLDLAVSGEGFFTVTSNGAKMYTRAGNFQTDANGYVINPQGAPAGLRPQPERQRLRRRPPVGPAAADHRQPAQVDLHGQSGLHPARQCHRPSVTPFSPADDKTYSHSTGGINVYDSLGVSHVQTSYFVKTANPNEWQVHNYVDGAAVGAPTTLQFSDTGALTTPANGIITMDPFTPSTGAGVLNMQLNVSGSTQYGEAFALRDTRQDGYASGKLNEISIDTSGVVFARYSNGADKPLGQVALSTFVNPQGLQSQGNNMWAESYTSGAARTGAPDTSDLGQIESGSLESSTVDLTEQLVNMIVAQRNFQANSQMISTQDQVTQTIINIR